jgi:hypothetical protein
MWSDSFAKIGVLRSMPGGDGMEVQFIGFPDILWRVTGGGLAAVDVGGGVLVHGCRSRGLPR